MGEANDSSVYKKLHRAAIAKATGKCALCPPHGGENRKRADRSRSKKRRRR